MEKLSGDGNESNYKMTIHLSTLKPIHEKNSYDK